MEIISFITDPLTVQAILNPVGEPMKPQVVEFNSFSAIPGASRAR
jgi:hypothetical protein